MQPHGHALQAQSCLSSLPLAAKGHCVGLLVFGSSEGSVCSMTVSDAFLTPMRQPASHALLQDQQRLKQEADRARRLAADMGDELASVQERMQQMQAELKGVKDTAREQLQELGQLKVVGRLKIDSYRHRHRAFPVVVVKVSVLLPCTKSCINW